MHTTCKMLEDSPKIIAFRGEAGPGERTGLKAERTDWGIQTCDFGE